MVKVIFKEILMVILLLVAIALILAIVFYEYIPTSKVLPAKVIEYKIPQELEKELNESILAEDNIIRSYQIDSQDLKIYESTKDYSKGKINPFEKEAIPSIDTTTNNNTTNNENTIDNSILKKVINK